jgi:tRNA (guanine26-N2/guanine27-N2)-dimethyltransferase
MKKQKKQRIDTSFITEGATRFKASKGKISKELDVFYNPVMKFNRDISIMLLNAIDMKKIQIADILAGSGVRSMRFFLELQKGIIESITMNDMSEDFEKIAKGNLKLNKLAALIGKKCLIMHKDANLLLLESKGFDYIDIDPFGSPNPFLEASIARLSRRGILAVTATDTAALCGTYPDACMRKYWSKPLNNYLMHEIGLRILIRKIQLVGAAHDKALVPVYAYAKDHYFRVFLQCEKSKKTCDDILEQHSYMLCCTHCLYYAISKSNSALCSRCTKNMDYAGPMWSGELWSKKLADTIDANGQPSKYLSNADKKFIQTITEESSIQGVGFYDVHQIAKKHGVRIPSFAVLLDDIRKKGGAVSRTHFSPTGIKTSMSLDELLHILRSLEHT